jgi:hypothetical protein
MFNDKNGSGSSDDNSGSGGNSGHAVEPARSSGSSPPIDDTHPSLRSIREVAASERKRRLSSLGYGGVHDYLAQHGRVFQSQPFTEEEVAHLREVFSRYRGERFPLGRCYENSMMLAMRNTGLTYVVGLANTGLVFMPHAWVSLNGKVVDVTCLKTWNPDRSPLLSPSARASLKASKASSAAAGQRRIGGRLGVFGAFPSDWFYVGEEFTDLEAVWRYEAVTGYHGTALRSKWFHPDPHYKTDAVVAPLSG